MIIRKLLYLSSAGLSGLLVVAQEMMPAPEMSETPAPQGKPGFTNPSYEQPEVMESVLDNNSGPDALLLPETLQQLLSDPFQWGPFRLRPHFGYDMTYATRVNLRPGTQRDTLRHTISPGVSLSSEHVSFQYSPSLTYYSIGEYQDHIDHNARLSSSFGYGDWQFQISQTYSRSSSALIETARQTERQTFFTSLSANYAFSPKTFFTFNLSQKIRDSDQFNNSTLWSTMNWINYRLADRVTVGAGAGGGYTDVEAGSDMTYQSIQGQASWSATTKLSLSVNGGIDIRQFLDIPDAESRVNPIMGATASYRLTDSTSFSLNASRRIQTSYLGNRVTENTGVTGSVRQRLLGRFHVSASAGIEEREYLATFESVRLDRSDSIFFVGAGTGTTILRKVNISVRYRHVENSSDDPGFGFKSDQYTLHLGYRF